MTIANQHSQPAGQLVPTSSGPDLEGLVLAIRRRLGGAFTDGDLTRLVQNALDDLSPVKVATYLPILIERRMRGQMRQRTSA